MKTVHLVFLIGALLPVSHTDQGRRNGFVEIFRDNFNSNGAPDPGKWKLEQTTADAHFPGERQVYRQENVAVENGLLHAYTKWEQYNGFKYTSGMVSTRGLFDFQYGELEWRAKVPDTEKIWGTVMLQNSQCDPTVPCRDFPGKITTVISGDEARASIADYVKDRERPPPEMFEVYFISLPRDFSRNFHVFKITWTPEKVVWFVDDVAKWTITGEAVPHVRMQVVMHNYANRLVHNVPPADAKFPSDFAIDYVVVRQFNNSTG
ncbi:endo-1,3-1,4-beta-glycanase ExsH-like [Paramacrobiotus metropolitanus]|uniref:endo-1,3-1,4-beta-glycanase ExsH-like n=1 Tax=Paramacrobiotus metropolitanus TaxID=2943436 RepID=UPI0024462A08|nr:endo-1,3-1,4-beta-glycanase ExsH-like [Paramacrobiotus metropolitanus]